MSSSAECVCVDPKEVYKIWPEVKSLIAAAMKRGGMGSFEDVEQTTLSGRGLLWIAWCRGRIEAAATTELQIVNDKLLCALTACGGRNRDEWLWMLTEIESFAKNEGCSAIRICGRRGWERVLQDYRVRRIVLEKDLD